MAQERPRASQVPTSEPAGDAREDAEPAEAVIGEVAAIVIRAAELGFSPTRVAVALGVSPRALASIEAPSASKLAP